MDPCPGSGVRRSGRRSFADGADCIDGVGQLCADREHVFGAKASTTTMWRLVDSRIDAAHLPGVRDARAARAGAWAAGAAPPAGRPLYIDMDATLVIDHSDNKADAAPTWKKTFGHHPLLAFLDRPEIAGGEALAGLLRKGNAGSNTAADHITVLDQALAALPAGWRPNPDADGAPAVVRCDSAGATHRFAQACRDRGVGFSFGFPVDARVWDAVDTSTSPGWYPAIDSSGDIRDGAWVAEATTLVNLATWPARTGLILRKERPHPGAQLRFTDIDGMRITAFITDTTPAAVPGQLAGLELRHRQHARVEDRIREAKSRRPGQPALPVLRRQRRLARNRAGRRRPGHLGPTGSDSPTPPSPPAARSTPSATGFCTSRPASPAAPANYGCASTPPGAGLAPSHPPGTASEPHSPDRQTSPDHHRPERPRPQERPPTRRHGQSERTPHPKSLPLNDFRGTTPPDPTGAKNRG